VKLRVELVGRAGSCMAKRFGLTGGSAVSHSLKSKSTMTPDNRKIDNSLRQDREFPTSFFKIEPIYKVGFLPRVANVCLLVKSVHSSIP